MKQFNYSVIAALFTLLLVTSCEKDPVPTVYDYRMAKAFKSVGSIPEYMGGDTYCLLFSIDDKAYVVGRTSVNAYNNLALYEYNSINNQWNIAWYVDNDFQPNSQQEIEECELQREVCRNLAALLYNQQMELASCTFNGKGYYFTNNAVMEFDPQARRWNLNPLYNHEVRPIVSTTQGIYQVGYDALSKYDIAKNSWSVESSLPYELWNKTDFFTAQDQIYIYKKGGLLGIYTPSNQQWEVIEQAIDLSSYQNDYYPESTPSGIVKTNFVLNNKYYMLYDYRYYEYDLISRSTCVIIFNENIYYINQLNHAFVADNKAFIIDTGSKLLMEFTP